MRIVSSSAYVHIDRSGAIFTKPPIKRGFRGLLDDEDFLVWLAEQSVVSCLKYEWGEILGECVFQLLGFVLPDAINFFVDLLLLDKTIVVSASPMIPLQLTTWPVLSK